MMRLFIVVLALAAIGCVSPTMRKEPITYAVSLQAVQRPASAEQRYGKQTIAVLTDSGTRRFRYTDSLVNLTFFTDGSSVNFLLENKTTFPIQLGWTEAAFVDLDGQSQPVMHAGVRYTDCAAPKAPSVIPGGGRLVDQAIPCNYVQFISAGSYSKWMTIPFLLPYQVRADSAAIAFPKLRTEMKGKTVRLLLPLKVQDVVNDYTFTFVIDDLSLGTAGPPPR